MVSGALVSNEGFGRDLSDLYDLMIYARSHDCSASIVDNMRKLYVHFENNQLISAQVGNPIKTLQNVRLVADPNTREEIRAQKRFQAIGLRVEFQRSAWIDHAEDFVFYHRYSNRFDKELADAKARAEHFRNLNLPTMAREIEKSVTELTNQTKTGQYLGFNKITLTSAAITLAKLLGYQFEPNMDRPDDSAIYDRTNGGRRLYCPIAYTLQEASDHISEEMLKLCEFLEKFPEMGDKPIFDHYRVLVPNFDFSFSTKLSSTYGPDGNPIFFVNQEKNSDFTMIKDGQTVGIFLGEKDGQMYFISYWV